jgi:hypothetical protein
MMASIRMAFDARKLIIAAAGLVLLQLGWSLLDLIFRGSIEVTPDVLPGDAVLRATDGLGWSMVEGIPLPHRLFEPARILIAPLSALLNPRSDWLAMLHALLGLVWLMGVWGFCGGAIARIACVQEAHARQPGIGEAVRFAWRTGPSLILAPIYPLVGLAFCSLTGIVFGLLYRVPAGPAVAGVLLFIPLAVGLVMTLLVAALVAGWPLFHAALASGADDALDALSRTYSYLNQRLTSFALGITLAWVIGLVGLALVDGLAGGVIQLTRWSLSLSGPGPHISALFSAAEGDPATVAAATHRFWLTAVRLLAHAWIFSYFWTAAALLYLWLRQDVDGTPATVIDPPGAGVATAGVPPSRGILSRPDSG